MKKADLKSAYTEARRDFEDDMFGVGDYACRLDAMLSRYFGVPLASPDLNESAAMAGEEE